MKQLRGLFLALFSFLLLSGTSHSSDHGFAKKDSLKKSMNQQNQNKHQHQHQGQGQDQDQGGLTSIQQPMTEQDFFNMLQLVENTYRPLFKKRKIDFYLVKDWKAKYVTTTAFYQNSTFVVSIPGEFARQEGMTVDSVALAACHEIGHFLGGSPRKTSSHETSWMAVEGQADYFATSKCLRRLFNNRPENRAAYLKLSPVVREEVKKKCQSYQCARILAASLNLIKATQKLEKDQSILGLQLQDSSKVSETLEKHPSLQCRLDTLVAGAKCKVSLYEDFDPYDQAAGACAHDALDVEEAKAARPLCWFAPMQNFK